MTKEQKKLLDRAEGAIIILKNLHQSLVAKDKDKESDWTLMVGSGIKAFKKMRGEWLFKNY